VIHSTTTPGRRQHAYLRTSTARGQALEELIAYLFALVAGISVTARNELNAFSAEEIDIAFLE
jgi:hypothetical protein